MRATHPPLTATRAARRRRGPEGQASPDAAAASLARPRAPRAALAAALAAAALLAAGAAAPLAAVPVQLKQRVVARVDSAAWCDDVRLLSGDREFDWQGSPRLIQTRYIGTEGNALAADWLAAQLEALGYAVSLDSFVYDPASENVVCRNVRAEKLGDTAPGRVVLLGAHYDSRSATNPLRSAPGAEDNATGAALVLAAARALAGRECALTLRFVLFSAEELGALGSRHERDRLLAAGDTLQAAVLADMVCWHRTDPILLCDGANASAWLPELVLANLRLFTGSGDSLQLSPQGRIGSDHRPFLEIGLPAVLLASADWSLYPGYHTIDDRWYHLADKTALGVDASRAAVAALADLAQLRPDPLSAAVDGLRLVASPAGVAVGWRTADLDPGCGLQLWRAASVDATGGAGLAGGPEPPPTGWTLLTPPGWRPAPGWTEWWDEPEAAGGTFWYRVDLVDARGQGAPVAGPVACAVPAPPPPAAARLTAWPNPANPGVNLAVDGLRPGPACVRVCDAAGREVRRLWRGWLGAERVVLAWDGRDDAGRRAPSGIYLARLEGEAGRATARVVISR